MKNRLTNRAESGFVYCTQCCINQDKDCVEQDCFKAILDRLAAYEDSGLSPDEVQELAQAKADGRLVEVVRCGECRHYNTTGCSDGCGWCENMDRGVFDEHYCSRGERREKE